MDLISHNLFYIDRNVVHFVHPKKQNKTTCCGRGVCMRYLFVSFNLHYSPNSTHLFRRSKLCILILHNLPIFWPNEHKNCALCGLRAKYIAKRKRSMFSQSSVENNDIIRYDTKTICWLQWRQSFVSKRARAYLLTCLHFEISSE